MSCTVARSYGLLRVKESGTSPLLQSSLLAAIAGFSLSSVRSAIEERVEGFLGGTCPAFLNLQQTIGALFLFYFVRQRHCACLTSSFEVEMLACLVVGVAYASKVLYGVNGPSMFFF